MRGLIRESAPLLAAMILAASLSPTAALLGQSVTADRKTIIFLEDPSAIARMYREDVTGDDLRHFIDLLADSRVDVLGKDVFAEARSIYYKTPLLNYDPRPQHVKFLRLIDSGTEPLDVYIERCHERNMQFWASFRMNDRHQHGAEFLLQHKEWWLDEFPHGLDFTFDEVRDWMFSVVEEVTHRFDVDGIQLDWMRWEHIFPTRTARQKQPIATAFMRRVKGMIDQAGHKKGKRILLGVRVPLTLERCHELGYNLPVWIEQGLVDFISPGAFNEFDCAASYSRFAELTAGTGCRLYPTLNPGIREGSRRDRLRHGRLADLPILRGMALSMYRQGADGLSAFNYQYLWARIYADRYLGPAENWPGGLDYFLELRDPETIRKKERSYVFPESFPLKPRKGERQTIPFRIFEGSLDRDFGHRNVSVIVRTSVTGLKQLRGQKRITSDAPPLVLSIELNGHRLKILPRSISRWNRVTWWGEKEALYEIAIDPDWLAVGDNRLDFTLERKPDETDEIIVRGVEVEVREGRL